MKVLLIGCTVLALMSASTGVRAGVYGDDLTKCLVSSTTDADKALLMKWIFSAMSLNKEVAGYVDMPADVREGINKDAGGLYMRLLTDSCKSQTRDAFKYEGQAAIGAAFTVLGQVASQGLFGDPAVAAGMADMIKHIDEDKLKAVLEAK